MKTRHLSFYALFIFSVFFSGCQKNVLDSTQEKSGLNTTTKNEVLPLKPDNGDTTTYWRNIASATNSEAGKKMAVNSFIPISAPKTRLTIHYEHNGKYLITVYNNDSGDNYYCNYHVLKNGTTADATYSVNTGNTYGSYLMLEGVFPPGNYMVKIDYLNAPNGVPPFNVVSFVIYEKPVIPAGKLPLLRYYNPTTRKRLYSNNWSEFASNSDGFYFEKVQGYLSSTSGTNLSLVNRYYNSKSGDHWSAVSSASFPDYVLEGALGYISTVSTADMNFPLQEWFSTTNGHTDVSPPETLPSPDRYIWTMGYIQPPVFPAYISEGSFIRNDDTGQVFWYFENKLRYIPNLDVLNGLFSYSELLLRHYSAAQLGILQAQTGTPISPDNGLIRDQHTGYVYFREGNFIRHIAALEALYRYNFNEKIIQNKTSLAGYTVGPDIAWLYLPI